MFARLRYALVVSLTLPSLAWAQSPEWLFPGEKLPADVGFSPLKASSQGDAQVRLGAQDWFLLQKNGVSQGSVETLKSLDVRGPVLNEINAQLYYRLMTGRVLQESMKQMGMNPAQARRLVEEAELRGVDFDKAKLEELGRLPEGFEDLSRNFARPMTRMATLPYLVLPLTQAMKASDLQHFQESALKQCAAGLSVAPLADVQTKINGLRAEQDRLAMGLREAIGLHQQSTAELARLTAKVKEQSTLIENTMACFSTIKDRVSRGTAMPEAACMAKAEEVFKTNGLMEQWRKFTTENMQNPRGDFSVLQEADIQLKTDEAALAAVRGAVQALQDQRAKLETELAANQEKLRKLSADRELQLAAEKQLNDEQATLATELQELQTVAHKLETGLMSTEKSESEVKALIAQTPARGARIAAIKIRQPQILQSRSQVQSNLSAILTQSEFVGRAIDTLKLQIQAVNEQLGDDQKGLTQQLNARTAAATAANERYQTASRHSNFSEYVLSHLTRALIEASKLRDQSFELLRKEETQLAAYKTQIDTAQKNKDAAWDKLNADIESQKQVIATYQSPKHMGWFLETDCSSRMKFDSVDTGIYLARSNVIQTGATADAGRWGMFHMPFNGFQNAIENGVLLDVAAYVEMSVRAIFENYDLSMSRLLDPAAVSCAEAGANSVLPMMTGAVGYWETGADMKARAQGVCQAVAAGQSYRSALTAQLQFRGSVLDQTLPKTHQAQAQDLIERAAVEALMSEMSTLNSEQNLDARRDRLVKALIRVLAHDYTASTAKAREASFQTSKYRFATPAPSAAQLQGLTLKVGEVREVLSWEGAELYASPVDRADQKIQGLVMSGEQVKILAIDARDPQVAMRAGWVKVSRVDGQGVETGTAAYMPAFALSEQSVLNDNGRAVYDLGDDSKCPVRRVVTVLTNHLPSDEVVTRFLPELKTGQFRGGMWQLVRGNRRTTAASINKTYVACELFQKDGQRATPVAGQKAVDAAGTDYAKVQGVRIVEVKVVKSRGGVTRYVPVEEYGGFVQTWLSGRSAQEPRIQLGGKLDAKTWSLEP